MPRSRDDEDEYYEDDDRDEKPRGRRSRREEPEADERPRRTSRRRDRDEDEDRDEPRSRRPRRDEDEDEERPRSRRPRRDRDEEDAPAAGRKSFRSGWSAATQLVESTSGYAQYLNPSNNLQVIRFLEDEPYAAYSRHWVTRHTSEGVKKRTYTCLASLHPPRRCPLCAVPDRPQSVVAFNVALIGDDGVPTLKTWDVGVRVFNQIDKLKDRPMVGGKISSVYWTVEKSGSGQSSQVHLNPVREDLLEEDYGIVLPDEDEIFDLEPHDASIIQIPNLSELEDIADEMRVDED